MLASVATGKTLQTLHFKETGIIRPSLFGNSTNVFYWDLSPETGEDEAVCLCARGKNARTKSFLFYTDNAICLQLFDIKQIFSPLKGLLSWQYRYTPGTQSVKPTKQLRCWRKTWLIMECNNGTYYRAGCAQKSGEKNSVSFSFLFLKTALSSQSMGIRNRKTTPHFCLLACNTHPGESNHLNEIECTTVTIMC